jgi:MFS family permease
VTADAAESKNATGLVATDDQRRALGIASAAHILHDGYTDLLYVLLPVWQSEFGLGYAEVGMLRGIYMAGMTALQIPASTLAERWGPMLVLIGGTLLAALAFLVAGASTEIAGLVAALLLGGIGASTQHPIASSLVAGAFAGAKSRTALGIYNFTGDVGKVALPALTAGLLLVMTWRSALWIVAGLGILTAALLYLSAPTVAAEERTRATSDTVVSDPSLSASPDSPGKLGFRLLFSISLIDSAARMGFLTFLPFLLQAKGASIAEIGLALSLVFAGGALGKLVCGYLGACLGLLATVVLTEGLTAGGILALLPLPLDVAMLLLPVIGIGLNGTSSVLYGTVPELVAPEARARAFGLFYTGTAGASAIAPPIMGAFGDRFGVPHTMAAIAICVLAAIPLSVVLNPILARRGRG